MFEGLIAVITILLIVELAHFWTSYRRSEVQLSPLEAGVSNLSEGMERLHRDVGANLAQARTETAQQARELRGEVSHRIDLSGASLAETLDRRLIDLGQAERSGAQKLHQEVQSGLKALGEMLIGGMNQIGQSQQQSFDGFRLSLGELTRSNGDKLDSVRGAVDQGMAQMQEANQRKLDEMRRTVDEKLQGTLEKRLGESFSQVSERLEQVHRGLGEMQNLASGVGDLKKLMTNVKARGTWGEMQLGNLLEQILAPEQYDANVETRMGSGARVEFAVKLPGKDADGGPIWLPIDAKFPLEDYQRLLEAQERADTDGMATSSKGLERTLRASARDISDRYLNPPATTDFGILFVPVEGLYAELLRRPGLVDSVQREYRVAVAGPTTLAALLNSLQLGFRTLAIQKRSSEVWEVLGAVKTEFEKFGGVLDKVQKKLQEANSVMEQAKTRTKVMERRLRTVQELPPSDAQRLLGLPETTEAPPETLETVAAELTSAEA